MKFLQNLYFYFEGRYGIDELSKFLTALSLVLFVLAMFFEHQLISLAGTGLLAYGFLRIMSKEVENRQKELRAYLKIKSSLQNSFDRLAAIFKRNRKSTGINRVNSKSGKHTIVSCPECSQRLRVPRGKKLSINCSSCHTKFVKQT